MFPLQQSEAMELKFNGMRNRSTLSTGLTGQSLLLIISFTFDLQFSFHYPHTR